MIQVSNLQKSFFVARRRAGFWGSLHGLVSREGRVVQAVQDVTFRIAPGEFVGYLGPNGAGKSTTIKMLTGILHPTSGEILIGGLSPQKNRQVVASQIGVVFGQRTQLWWDLPTLDSFELLAALYAVPRQTYLARLRRFDELLGLGEFLDVPVRKLSLGQRMRADLAAALLHQPAVLFLDEPTIGLDVVAKARMRDFLREINQRDGVTVLLTTHDMGDIEQLCQRVLVLSQGHLVFDGTIAELRGIVGVTTLLTVEYYFPPPSSLENGLSVHSVNGNTVTVAFDRSRQAVSSIIHALGQLGEIKDIYLAEPSSEEVVRRFYEKGTFPELPGSPHNVF